jgi:superfamily II DNA helicase RecQ
MDKEFEIISGKVPVLLSAPHVYAHRRPSIRGVLKHGEPRTGELVREVSSISGAYGIVATKNIVEYDPNYNQLENNPYKFAIKDLFKEKKVRMLIDVHGLSDHHQYDFGIFYCMRFKRSKELTHKLLKELSDEKELKSLSYYIGYTVKNRQETLTEYVSEKLKFPALQIEVARYIREDEKLFKAVEAAISRFISQI